MDITSFYRCQTSIVRSRPRPVRALIQMSKVYVCYSTVTDSFVEQLSVEKGSKRELILIKYFKNNPNFSQNLVGLIDSNKIKSIQLLRQNNINILVNYIETKYTKDEIIQSQRLNDLIIYLAKNGHVNGVKAVQVIIKKHNPVHFHSQSGYSHYLAEAYWICGRIEDSLKLFNKAYDNAAIQLKIKSMLKCLFSLLISENSEAVLYKTVHHVNQFCVERNDYILLAFLWKELFQSTWFSHQQLSKELYENNTNLLHIIQWMIPTLGKDLLKGHRIDDYYRLIQFSLETKLKIYTEVLIRFLFDYYYIHKNIERCSAVVKYANHLESPLTEEQHRRYVSLLLKSKDANSSKLNVRKPQNLKYKF